MADQHRRIDQQGDQTIVFVTRETSAHAVDFIGDDVHSADMDVIEGHRLRRMNAFVDGGGDVDR